MPVNREHIFHLTTPEAWADAERSGSYSGDTLLTEGFIHCSHLHQLSVVARRYFAGKQNLVLLEINSTRLKSVLKFEGKTEKFPHIYGELNVSAVHAAYPFAVKDTGEIELPRELLGSGHV